MNTMQEGISVESIKSQIRKQELTPPLDELAEQYEERVGIRDTYVWKWFRYCFTFGTLDCVPDRRLEYVATHKSVLSMYITLIDDLSEVQADKASFREAKKIPFDHMTADTSDADVDSEYLEFMQEVWETVERLFEEAPRESEFRDLFEFDFKQTLHGMEYEYLVNDSMEITNEEELMDYTQHNMMILPAVDVDMMYSPAFDRRETHVVRKTAYRCQRLARMSNWLSTWERELEEGDFSSPLFTEAVEKGVVSIDEFESFDESDSTGSATELVAAVRDAGIEQDLEDRWQTQHSRLRSELPEADSVDLESYLDAFDTVYDYHMASKGLK